MPLFFQQHAQKLLLPKAKHGTPGLRRAQLGATHALGAHFSLSVDPALISMPTGTGKTAVIMLVPFLLESKRALVITPSRMVRDQIMEGFTSLELLKNLRVLPSDLDSPTAVAVESRIRDAEDWNAFVDADVVITTPMGSSPAIQQISQPPADLFDLLLVDEAHHSPADTWSALINAFPQAKCILFTATPFRRDRKRLPGRFVYEFPLREALKDGVFGQIEFVPCEPVASGTNDEAIAKHAEELLQADRSAGLDHRIMVRTDSRTRAHELAKTYATATSLKLAVIHGQHTLTHVRKTVLAIKSGELDGVICVDMFGEGFDLPQLKIAAIHSPHKSLSVTLQFIGRFARTSGSNLGTAKFIAVREEIQAETDVLYEEGAVWRDLVPNLADARVAAEREVREKLSTFSRPPLNETVESDLDLGIITPWYHSKVFKVSGAVVLDQDLAFRPNENLVRRFYSDELSCAVYIFRTMTKPRWLETPTLQDVEYSLCVVYFDTVRGLLFINSTEKTEDFYSLVAEHLTGDGVFCGIPSAQISRALRLINLPAFYSVGLKNRLLGNDVESYRILSGSKVDGAVSNLDAQLFDRGHLFGGGESAEGKVTLGVSTLSKVWSNRSGFVPEFITWCKALAENLSNTAPVVTGSRIDLLAVGEEVSAFPATPIGTAWHESAYKQHPILVDLGHGGVRRELLALDMRCITTDCTSTVAIIELLGFDAPVRVRFNLQDQRRFRVLSSCNISVHIGKSKTSLDDYLNSVGIHFYLADFSRLFGNEWYRSNLTLRPLPTDCVRSRDWLKAGVDIAREFGTSIKGTSIHDFLATELCGSPAEIVVYDHRPGEIADFISLHRDGTTIRAQLIHCKGSGENKPGSRVEDAYEIAGQIVKCIGWVKSPGGLRAQLTRRLASGSKIKKGDLTLLEELLTDAERQSFDCRIVLVQPGISFKKLSDEVSHVLAGAYEYVIATTGRPPSMWLSE